MKHMKRSRTMGTNAISAMRNTADAATHDIVSGDYKSKSCDTDDGQRKCCDA